MPRKAQANPLHQPSYLKQWRTFRSLSQEELAARAGIKHTTISRLERGVSGWVQDTMEKLAEALDCSVSELLFMDPEHPEEFFRNITAARRPVARKGFADFIADAAAAYSAGVPGTTTERSLSIFRPK